MLSVVTLLAFSERFQLNSAIKQKARSELNQVVDAVVATPRVFVPKAHTQILYLCRRAVKFCFLWDPDAFTKKRATSSPRKICANA